MSAAVLGAPLQWRVYSRSDFSNARSAALSGAGVVRNAWGLGRMLGAPLRMGARTIKASKSDGSVIDRPKEGTDKKPGKSKKGWNAPIYKLLLHNDSFNRREYVVQVLLKVVDVLAMDDAIKCMQEAHESGVAFVTACAQEDAEKYCQGLRNNGLTATIEPDTGSGGGLN